MGVLSSSMGTALIAGVAVSIIVVLGAASVVLCWKWVGVIVLDGDWIEVGGGIVCWSEVADMVVVGVAFFVESRCLIVTM